MGALGVLHRQLVQPEEPLQLLEVAGLRLVQADPDELVAPARLLGGLLERERALVLAGPIVVVGAIDDHGMTPAADFPGSAVAPASGLPDPGIATQMEAEILVKDVQAFDTKGGSKRYVVRDAEGNEYTTFREQIGEDAMRAKGRRAAIEHHEQRRGEYTNVYLDSIKPLDAEPGDAAEDEQTDPEEAGWRTAVDAAPWLLGSAQPDEEVPPDELFEKLEPFKDRVAEDIREKAAGEDED